MPSKKGVEIRFHHSSLILHPFVLCTMCGRYTLFVSPEVLKARFKSTIDESLLPKLAPRYNIAPTQDVPVITSAAPHHILLMRWGLIPSWAKDESIGNKLINARAETLPEKPSFKTSFKHRRCLILANGFYEWRQDTKPKQPMYISLKSGEPFALAGLWDVWKNPLVPEAAPLRTCTIITTEPNDFVAPMHHRMAVILAPHEEALWLNEQASEQELMSLLRPYPSEELTARPVSSKVNNVGFDHASLLDESPTLALKASASMNDAETVNLHLF
jgi:putative SOS response-associated peptidase YedK